MATRHTHHGLFIDQGAQALVYYARTCLLHTQSLGALCIAKLVDSNQLRYDDLVIKHWPEFGAHGKHNVTIEWLVSHQAGLAGIDHEITFGGCERC
jgi:hypothetical protein